MKKDLYTQKEICSILGLNDGALYTLYAIPICLRYFIPSDKKLYDQHAELYDLQEVKNALRKCYEENFIKESSIRDYIINNFQTPKTK